LSNNKSGKQKNLRKKLRTYKVQAFEPFLFYREEMEVAKLKATLEAVELKMRQEDQKKAQEEEEQKR
jgi:hypothetical protein